MITMNAHADSHITMHKLTHTAYIGTSTHCALGAQTESKKVHTEENPATYCETDCWSIY